jgi:hypothetical protein
VTGDQAVSILPSSSTRDDERIKSTVVRPCPASILPKRRCDYVAGRMGLVPPAPTGPILSFQRRE